MSGLLELFYHMGVDKVIHCSHMSFVLYSGLLFPIIRDRVRGIIAHGVMIRVS